jgi:hypothetical protein
MINALSPVRVTVMTRRKYKSTTIKWKNKDQGKLKSEPSRPFGPKKEVEVMVMLVVAYGFWTSTHSIYKRLWSFWILS